jgi:hypothetical protein
MECYHVLICGYLGHSAPTYFLLLALVSTHALLGSDLTASSLIAINLLVCSLFFTFVCNCTSDPATSEPRFPLVAATVLHSGYRWLQTVYS